MSESKICTICGGYIVNAILTATATTTSAATAQTITFCPGHSTTDADLSRQLPVMHAYPENELMYIPAESSIFPPDLSVFWKIVQGVAEEDSTYRDDCDSLCHCLFCYVSTSNFIDPFPHDKECIVVKARELMAWREAQPTISIRVAEVPRD